ncbi:hypothetical protein C8034_v003945 [Colletotrichum sidae]|uniref:EthD domain-containing protein n=1 Tax=Colletotrichum sidae TaxID=1347389 RepID=A0A4R8TN92_9PEZI|nr:hypothetical protein C8034_v003945 [Colletotrichum sidae]
MSIAITVLFRNEADARYDLAYYANTHMPLVQREWQKYGVTGWSVVKYGRGPGPDGAEPPFVFGSTVTWAEGSQVQTAFAGPETARVFADVPNFSNKEPLFLYGEVVRREGV